MSKATKIIVSLVVIILVLLAVVIYYKSKVMEERFSDEPIVVSSVKTGDSDLDNLLSSLDQEQSEETRLLSSSEDEVSALADESSLLDDVNQTYQNDL